MILSTEMSNFSNIEDAVSTVLIKGNPTIILARYNSSYLSAENEMNLSVIDILKLVFKAPVGSSDHSFDLFS
jgi:sialic acid synthase SpsE